MTKMEFARTAKPPYKARYGNYIDGQWAEPVNGRYFENTSPVNGRVLCEIARSHAAEQLELPGGEAPSVGSSFAEGEVLLRHRGHFLGYELLHLLEERPGLGRDAQVEQFTAEVVGVQRIGGHGGRPPGQ